MDESEKNYSINLPPLTFISFASRKARLVYGQYYQHYIRPARFYNQFSKFDSGLDNMEAYAPQASLKFGG
jgi:hypothetical protein